MKTTQFLVGIKIRWLNKTVFGGELYTVVKIKQCLVVINTVVKLLLFLLVN